MVTMADSTDEKSEDAIPPRRGLGRLIDRAKAHPAITLASTVAVTLITFQGAGEAVEWIAGKIDDIRNPYSELLADLASLSLDQTPRYFESNFGVAEFESEVCIAEPGAGVPVLASCTGSPPPGEPLTLFIHRTDEVEVRALFDGEALGMYAVTTVSADFRPQIIVLDDERGELGPSTYRAATDWAPGPDPIGPTDVDVFLGPQSSAYAEVFSLGAPGAYRGFLLASAPAGLGSLDFNLEAAHKMDVDGKDDDDPRLLTSFRANSQPNTYGEFRDDGSPISEVLANAGNVRMLLYEGTEL
ncbi:ETEC_3214 domain-containing protein [Isoptericola sp. NPDC019482]|uniref:ETEC_3214 domain-containing protein n=1 Tax=Isoptericola sp. NPDC019482 TaxID=3154688 RepID=UPI00347CB158